MPDDAVPGLRPCPFCGGTDFFLACTREEFPSGIVSAVWWVVGCRRCPGVVEGPRHHTRAEAIAAWNGRTGDIGRGTS